MPVRAIVFLWCQNYAQVKDCVIILTAGTKTLTPISKFANFERFSNSTKSSTFRYIMPNITLYDAITNLPGGTPRGIGTPSGTALAYGQIPLPSTTPAFVPSLAAGALSPNTTGINTATIYPPNRPVRS